MLLFKGFTEYFNIKLLILYQIKTNSANIVEKKGSLLNKNEFPVIKN